MAIDSAAKRRSAAGVGFFVLGPGVTPSASPDAFWRRSAAWSYGAVVASGGGGGELVATRYRYGYRLGYAATGLLLFFLLWS